MSIPKCQQHRKAKTPICFDCELQSKCKFNCMPGQGLKNGIMIVGEKPTSYDVSALEPFRGLEGQKLKFLLHQAGLMKEQCYVTYAIKCDSPKNIASSKAKKLAKICRTHLLEEIAWVKPKAIITLGTTAFTALTGEDLPADDYRGFPMPLQGKGGEFNSWIIPTYSITQAIGSASKDPVMVRDIKLAKKIVREGYVPPAVDVDVRVLTSVQEVKELVGKLWRAKSFSYDLETGGLDFLKNPIQCASFSIDGKTAYVVPIDREFTVRGQTKKWTSVERKQILWLLARAFMSPASKTAQNGKFDNKFLRRYGIKVRRFDFDTMLAHHLVDEGKPHDLMFIAQWYGIVHEKYDHALEMQKRIHGDDWMSFDTRTLYHYAGIDAAVTQLARPILERELERTKTKWVHDNISIPQSHVLADMEYRGARMNLVGMNKIIKETDEKIIQLKVKVKDLMKVDDFNPNSTKQLKEYMKAKRVRIEKKTPAGDISVDEEVLKTLVNHPRVGDVARMTLEMRSLTKLKGTYLDGKAGGGSRKKTGLRNKLDENHYIHTEFLIHGTYTGRLSSKNPNLQNIPKAFGIRQLFIPDRPEDILMSVDYKQLEVRVAAAISKDPVLIREVIQGVDMHSRNAATLLLKVDEKHFEGVLSDKNHPDHKRFSEARRAAKAVTFGVLYGSTAHGVAARNKLDLELCEAFIRKFFKKYRVLSNWIKNQHSLVRKTHMVRTPTGRYIRFNDLDWAKSKYCPDRFRLIRTGEVERISVNMPIQGFGSDIFQTHKIKVFKHLAKQKMGSRLLLSLHDGFVMNVKPEERAALTESVPKLMYAVLNKGTKFAVPLEVDIEFGKCWEGKDDE